MRVQTRKEEEGALINASSLSICVKQASVLSDWNSFGEVFIYYSRNTRRATYIKVVGNFCFVRYRAELGYTEIIAAHSVCFASLFAFSARLVSGDISLEKNLGVNRQVGNVELFRRIPCRTRYYLIVGNVLLISSLKTKLLRNETKN